MALKAGYVGVKRWLYEKLTKESAANKQSIFDLWAANAITGAKNLFGGSIINPTVKSGCTCTLSNAVYTITTTTTDFSGVYWSKASQLSAFFAGFAGVKAKLSFDYKAEAEFSGQVGFSDIVTIKTDYQHYEKSITDLSQIDNIVIYDRDTTASHTISVKNVMICIETDTDENYAPYAMTNQQLTTEAATLESVDDAHKTVINGIISAATGAADFAAFKTAMAALTPLTRSAAPAEETRGTVEVDEPVTTKTTKKTTK